MKVAICLHGYFGTLSTNDFSTVHKGFAHIESKVASLADEVDFYVHCWQPEFKSDIEKLYSPKKAIYEEQKDFESICKENKISQEYIDRGFPWPRSSTMYKNANAERILSFYYSRCQSLDLVENKNYDFVMTTRFDISQRGGPEVRELKFDRNLDNDYLYTAEWNQKNVGYGDMWFYASPDIMHTYSQIYKHALVDFKKESNYEKCLTTGWPDSQYFNVFSPTDPRQFSNEMDRKEKSKNLMKFPRWRVTDCHLHHKWFCMQTGLYQKTKWL